MYQVYLFVSMNEKTELMNPDRKRKKIHFRVATVKINAILKEMKGDYRQWCINMCKSNFKPVFNACIRVHNAFHIVTVSDEASK